jgi:hypothetical protein
VDRGSDLGVLVGSPRDAPTRRALCCCVRGAAALFGWTETVGNRADGEFVSWSTENEYSGTRRVDDPQLQLVSLVAGTERYPKLQELLPARPDGATDCRHLAYPIFAESRILCSECCGLGWILPDRNVTRESGA